MYLVKHSCPSSYGHRDILYAILFLTAEKILSLEGELPKNARQNYKLHFNGYKNYYKLLYFNYKLQSKPITMS
jgi:hypothetical protein